MPKFYELSSSNLVFYVVVHSTTGEIFIVNPAKSQYPCVVILFDKSDDSMILQSLSHFDFCSVNTNLPKKTGTVTMMKTVLTFARRVMDARKVKVEFDDRSGFRDTALGVDIDLGTRDLFMYGKTWYQQNIGFNIKPVERLWRRNLKAIQKTLQRHKPDFKVPGGNSACLDEIPKFMAKHDLTWQQGVAWKGVMDKDLVNDLQVRHITSKKEQDALMTRQGRKFFTGGNAIGAAEWAARRATYR